ncbi:MAG TPA: ribosome biogenesis GTPase Der [Kofleriaceae bacterium]|jgi:GTP-binding protein|nr:ribosome biogenesis GTPase Der [Kofleriaceae bacterium]
MTERDRSTHPLLAIVGRPNVGKSTLYNRLVGGRPALVHDTPGLTRDRRYGECDYFGAVMRVVDTGGLDPDAVRDATGNAGIGAGIHRQALRAIGEADALVLVVDGRAGLSAIDQGLATQLRATGKPVFLAVNKIDHPTRDDLVHDFHSLGLGTPYPVSAAHGRGIDALLEAITDAVGARPPEVPEAEPADRQDLWDILSSDSGEDAGGEDAGDDDAGDEDAADDDGRKAEEEPAGDDEGAAAPGGRRGASRARRGEADARPLRIAFVGRPNAGKSSLTNRLLGEERSLVHHVAGTTTDPVDTAFSIGGREYVLVDTAGIRRKAKIDADVEKLAVTMALSQIERADIVVLVIDADLGPAEQDARIAGMVEQAGRGLVIALNKSDLVRSDAAKAQLGELTKDTFHFLTWAPVVRLSAQRGDGVDRLLDLVDNVAREHRKRIATAQLNRFFAEVIEEMPPPLHHGRAVRIHYLTQATTRPPTFVLWANTLDGLAPSYKRFLVNRLRDRYGFVGTPIRIAIKARHDRHKPSANA